MFGEKIKFGFWNFNRNFVFDENYFLIYISHWNLYDIYSPYFHFFNFKLTDVQFFFDNNDFSEGLN